MQPRIQQALRGFTLPELLTAVAIAGLALALAVPGLNDALATQRRAAAVNGLVGTLQLARSTALTRNQAVTICPSSNAKACEDTPWERGWIAFIDPALQGQPGAAGVLAAEPGLPGPFALRSAEFDGGLAYRPSGQSIALDGKQTTGTFWFCDGTDAARGLWINGSGKAQLVDRQANALPDPCPEGPAD